VIRVVLLLSVLGGCGRWGFDAAGDGGGSTGDGRDIDAPTACVPDGFCVTACGASDPDCTSICGDGTCVANVGETCDSCSADCKTTTPVCGNLACDPGENGTNCPSDCGPIPWPWSAEETELAGLVNNQRVNGVTCPGMMMMTAVPLADDPDLDHAARDLAWEAAQYGTVGQRRCDGLSILSFMANTGASNSRISSGTGTNQDRIAAWVADVNACPQLIDPARVSIGVGIATGATTTTYVVLMH